MFTHDIVTVGVGSRGKETWREGRSERKRKKGKSVVAKENTCF